MQALQPERRIASRESDFVYYAFGAGPPLLFANGLAAGWHGFHNQLAHLAGRYRCLTWEYRGVFRDGQAATRMHAGVLADHAADALAILDAEGAERAAVLGWSLGVQVALQMFRDAPSRIASLALVSGVPHACWAAGAESTWLRKLLYPGVFGVVGRVPRLSSMLLRAGGRSPEVVTWARRVGLIGSGADPELVTDVARELCRVDMLAVLENLRAMAEHDLNSVLASIDVPTLVIGGDRDPFTPRAALEHMAGAVSGAERLLLPGATHYVLLDHAEHVNLRLDKFLAEHGYGA